MTQPNLSPPTLFNRVDCLAHPSLAKGFMRLANAAFRRSKEPEPEKWNYAVPRFRSADMFYSMLVDEGMVALIFDIDRDAEVEEDKKEADRVSDGGEKMANGNSSQQKKGSLEKKRIIACAAAVPWKGGWAAEGAGKETGWEIKAVSVDGDEKYLRRGLAIQVMRALEEELIRRRRAELKSSGAKDGKAEITCWIMAAECINGGYWRKRGFCEVRRKSEGNGTWQCRTSFDMLVLRRDVEFEI